MFTYRFGKNAVQGGAFRELFGRHVDEANLVESASEKLTDVLRLTFVDAAKPWISLKASAQLAYLLLCSMTHARSRL